MINGISRSGYLPSLQMVSSSSSGTAASFADTLASATTQGTLVSISEQAKAAAGSTSTTASISTQADATAQLTNLNIQKATADLNLNDYNKFFATEAAAVSVAQGLPAGQYDFTNLSPKEAQIIAMDAQRNHGASFDDVRALNAYANSGTNYSSNGGSVVSNTPGDALSATLNMQMVVPDDNGSGYEVPKGSLKWMLSVQGTSIPDSLQQSISSALSANSSASLQTSTPTTTPVTAQTKAAAAAQVASFDLTKSNIGMSQADYAAYYAAGAASVSASQGLPTGQYDFTKLSPKEAEIVVGDAGMNHGASAEDTAGLREYALLGTKFPSSGGYIVSNTPGNALSEMVNLSRTTTDANGNNYGFNDTLKWMLNLQGTQISRELEASVQQAVAANQ